jgi:hypothetical protein
MVYLKNSTELQEVYIPKMKHDADDVKTPYEIGYEDGRKDQKNEDVSKLEDIFIDKNGTYIPNFGYKKVEVNCEGGPLEKKSVAIDGDFTEITPSEGFYGIGKAVIDATNYGNSKKEEQKNEDDAKLTTKEITENGEYKADYGFSSVTVNVDVDPKLQEKSVYLKIESDERQTVTPDKGYDGLSSVYVDALELSIYRYQAGFQQAKDMIIEKTYALGENEDTATIEPDRGLGMSVVNLDATAYGNAKFAAGKASQKSEDDAKLGTLTATKNGNYDADYGFSSVTVNLPLEEKSVVLTATTQEIVPSSATVTTTKYVEVTKKTRIIADYSYPANCSFDIDYVYFFHDGLSGNYLKLLHVNNGFELLFINPKKLYYGYGKNNRSLIYSLVDGHLILDNKGVVVNDERIITLQDGAEISAQTQLVFFGKEESSMDDAPVGTKLGTIKIYNSDGTLYDTLSPCETSDGVGFHSELFDTYFYPSYGALKYVEEEEEKEGTDYEGMSKVTVDASNLIPSLQEEKTIDITDNGVYTLTPDDTYEAIKKGTITVSINKGLNITDNNLVMYTSTDGKKVVPFFNAEIVKGVVTSSAFKSFEGQRLLFSNLYTETLKGLYIIDGELGYMVDSGFLGCSTLSSISFPDSLKEFGDTFEGCSSLSSITFGTGLEILQTELVFVIPSLKEITFKGATPPTIATHYTPSDIPTDVKLWVPKGALETYQTWLATTGFPSTWTIQEMQ